MHKKTFWPYGILGSIFAIVCACAYTIYYSLDYPVYLDEFYFDKYQNVENSYNEIQIAQTKFNQNFYFDPAPKNASNLEPLTAINLPKKRIAYAVSVNTPLNLAFETNAILQDAKILLTHPHTSEFNQNLSYKTVKSTLEIGEFLLPKKGRWQLMLKLTANNNSVGFYKIELFAK